MPAGKYWAPSQARHDWRYWFGDVDTVYRRQPPVPSEHRMGFATARRAGRVRGALIVFFAWAGVAAGIAAERGFPNDSVLLLEARPMKGSKRVPILQIESKGEASIDLWCNRVPA